MRIARNLPGDLVAEAMGASAELEACPRCGHCRAPGELPPVPDVGDIVLYKMRNMGKADAWRVTGWYVGYINPSNEKMRYRSALPEEATHVGLYAICGVIAPIAEVTFIDKSVWLESEYGQSEKGRALEAGRARTWVN